MKRFLISWLLATSAAFAGWPAVVMPGDATEGTSRRTTKLYTQDGITYTVWEAPGAGGNIDIPPPPSGLQYALEVNTGDGIASATGAGIYTDGDVAQVQFNIAENYEAPVITGDIEGISLAGNVISVPMTGARVLSISAGRRRFTLSLITGSGITSLTGGGNYDAGTNASATFAVNPNYENPFLSGDLTGVTTGASTFSVPMDQNRTITVAAAMKYFTLTLTQGTGIQTLVRGNSDDFLRVASGETATISYVSALNYGNATLTGDTSGVTTSGTTITIPMTSTRAITVSAPAAARKLRATLSGAGVISIGSSSLTRWGSGGFGVDASAAPVVAYTAAFRSYINDPSANITFSSISYPNGVQYEYGRTNNYVRTSGTVVIESTAPIGWWGGGSNMIKAAFPGSAFGVQFASSPAGNFGSSTTRGAATVISNTFQASTYRTTSLAYAGPTNAFDAETNFTVRLSYWSHTTGSGYRDVTVAKADLPNYFNVTWLSQTYWNGYYGLPGSGFYEVGQSTLIVNNVTVRYSEQSAETPYPYPAQWVTYDAWFSQSGTPIANPAYPGMPTGVLQNAP